MIRMFMHYFHRGYGARISWKLACARRRDSK